MSVTTLLYLMCTCSLESSHSPDVSTCYQTAVDDDDEEHLVRATVADNTVEYSDFASGEEPGTHVVDCSVSCSRSDCVDSSPLPSADTFLSGRLVSPVSDRHAKHCLLFVVFDSRCYIQRWKLLCVMCMTGIECVCVGVCVFRYKRSHDQITGCN